MSRRATFWDRRRAAVEAESEAAKSAVQAKLDAQHQQELAEKSEEEVLAELGLPDPDGLAQGDDFTAFMARAVPEHLRKRALRKLWQSNPVLACVDGLNDYDDDYLTGSYGNAPIKTSYQVGKGLLEHVLEQARLDEREAEPEILDIEPVLEEDTPIGEPDVVMTNDLDAEPDDVPVRLAEPEYNKPRRMAFYFDRNDA